MSVRAIALAAPLCLAAGCASLPDIAQGSGVVADPFSCAGEASLSFGGGLPEQLRSVRDIAPAAGGEASRALAVDADHALAAYTLYDAFEADSPPADAFAVDGFGLVGLIYGRPGPDTERPRARERGRTLYGYVASDTDTGRLLIAFRGTMQPSEWVRNVQARQIQLPFDDGAAAQVHRGFYEIYETLEFQDAVGATPFSDMLASGILNSGEVTFVGHSLGGALASLAATEAALRHPANAARIEVTTLGSPRVGDQAFADLASAVGRHTRVCNLVDPVPEVPISTARVRYVHAGETRRYSSFDYTELTNVLSGAGEQILCWHGASSYRLMLEPATFDPEAEPDGAACFASTGS